MYYIPTKKIKVTDAFVEWWKNNDQDIFLGLEIPSNCIPRVEGNTFTTVWSKNEKSPRFGRHFIFGEIDSMRKEWFEYNEQMRKYCEEEEEHEWNNISWKDFIIGNFYVNEEGFYIAEG